MVRDLTEPEQENLAQSRDQLTILLREEEIRYYQRAKVKDVLLGDNNTRYFQMVTNGKHWKKKEFLPLIMKMGLSRVRQT